MRLFFLTTLVMLAFAANSVLGRWAIGGGHIGAVDFGLLRLVSGAAMLWALCALRRAGPDESLGQSVVGGVSLLTYILGFSMSYVALDAGLGALILFGVVQVTMFFWGLARGQRASALQLGGAAVALLGLAYVVWPGAGGSVPLWAAALMGLGGFGWGVYSLAGRGARDALGATTVNFTLASVFLLPWLWISGGAALSALGMLLAVVSGAGTSALGYALWYRLLPQIAPPVAATVQLSVPVIAILAGSMILGEAIGFRLVIGAVLVLGGIALVVRGK